MGQRLLIVDSDRRFIKDHQAALEAAFDVEFINNTEAVPARLATGSFGAVLICVEVSENKGYALCSILRRTPELAGVKIGLISSKATDEEYARHRSLKGRAADLYLRKPIESSTLVTELSMVVPLRGVDPDNPLGDLSGSDLGDEWLDSLKSELGEEPSVPALISPAPSAPAFSRAPQYPPVNQSPLQVEIIEPLVFNQAAVSAGLPQGYVERAPMVMDAQTIDVSVNRTEITQKLRQEAEQLLETIQDLKAKLNEKEELCVALESRTRNAEEEARELEDRCTSLERRLGSDSQSDSHLAMEAQLKEEKSALESRVQELESSQERADRRLDELLMAKDAAERNALMILGEKAELEKKLNSFSGEFERSKEIERQSEEKHTKIRALEEDRAAMSGKVEAIQSRLDAKAAEMAERVKEVDALKVDIAGLEATLRGQRRELADQSTKIFSLTRESEGFLINLNEQKQKIQELEGNLSNREENIRQLEKERQDLQQVRADLEETLSQSHKELQETKKDYESRIDALKAEHASQLQIKAGEMEALKAEHVSQLQVKANEMEALKAEHASQLQAKANEMEALKAEHASELQAKTNDFERQLQQKIDDYESRMADNQTSHEKALLDLMQEVEDRESRIRRISVDLETNRENVQELQQVRKTLEGDLNSKTARLEALTSAISDLEVNIRRASDLTRPF